jgi:hypothetical protein
LTVSFGNWIRGICATKIICRLQAAEGATVSYQGLTSQVAQELLAVGTRADSSRLKPLGMTKEKGCAARLKPCPDTKRMIRDRFNGL